MSYYMNLYSKHTIIKITIFDIYIYIKKNQSKGPDALEIGIAFYLLLCRI